MTSNFYRETATVFQFPFQPRRRLDNGLTAPVSIFEVSANVVDTSCWYHDEALRDVGQKSDFPKSC